MITEILRILGLRKRAAKRAQMEVVRWLREGGHPNDVIPFHYDFLSGCPNGDQACAGAAMAFLLGEVGHAEVGKKYFGDKEIFILKVPVGSYNKPLAMADYLESLELRS